MSTAPPPRDPSDDADERYRRASERDASRPSEETRRAVLEHAERLAAERRGRREGRRRWLSLAGIAPGWRPALAGTLAVAALAGVVIAPQFMAPDRPPVSQVSPSTHEEAAPPPMASVAP